MNKLADGLTVVNTYGGSLNVLYYVFGWLVFVVGLLVVLLYIVGRIREAPKPKDYTIGSYADIQKERHEKLVEYFNNLKEKP